MSDTTYSRRILRTYGLLVDFEGKPRLKNVPSPLEGRKAAKETMEKWTQRVLGDEVSKVRVYRPVRVQNETLVSSITNTHDATLLQEIVRGAVRKKAKSAKEKIQDIQLEHKAELKIRRANARELRKIHEGHLAEKIDEIIASTAYLPLDDLQDLVAELRDELHPSVCDWVRSKFPTNEEEVSVNDILKLLLRRMSTQAKGETQQQHSAPSRST